MVGKYPIITLCGSTRFKEQNPDGALELYDKVFCLDLALTRVTRVSDRW